MRPSLPARLAAPILALLAAAAAQADGPALRVEPSGAITALPFEVRGGASATSQPLFVVDHPPVAASSYQITGSVEYQDVAGTGYLEMWSVFADGSRYFSRTLAPTGPMAALSGRSGARPFALPFYLGEGTARPERLEVNVVLPAAGRVMVSGLRFASPVESKAPGAWWSPEQGGVFGAVAGTLVGLMGAAIGTLCSLGIARTAVEALLRALAVAGAASLACAAIAFASGQPYEVWYPLALLGAVATPLALAMPRVVRRRYDQADARRA
jgi:hypothetical protein